MLESLVSLSAAQAVRSATFPIKLSAPQPASEWLLESPRERNAALDALFYDVGALSPEESQSVAMRYITEGAILEVGPSSAPSLRMWRNYDDFCDQGEDYAALAVAGVGSSALGSAAFARNVADAAGGKVLAVVSGYGLADLLTETLGGYFLFGALNQMRHAFEWLDDLRRGAESAEEALPQHRPANFDAQSLLRCSDDVRTLIALLSGGRRFDWLIGHSKGNLVLSEALFAICRKTPEIFDRVRSDSRIVTISAKIAMPRGFAEIIDVMGEFDAFGVLNSRSFIETDVKVPLAWHHTNTELPFHLDVAATLRPILAG